MIKRFDRLDVASSNPAETSATYKRNFGFKVKSGEGSEEATIAIGDAEIRICGGPAVADVIASTGEGLAAIWLEAAHLDEVARSLTRAGLSFSSARIENGRRVLAVDPAAANMVRLFIFDRRV